MTVVVKPAAARKTAAWPPVHPLNHRSTDDLPVSQYDHLASQLPFDLADREILFVTGTCTFAMSDPLPAISERNLADTEPKMWNGEAIRGLFSELSRIREARACVLVLLTNRTGPQILTTASPFLGWGMSHNGGERHSSNVRSITLLDVDKDALTCSPVLYSPRNPERTTFDGQMDVILPSRAFDIRRPDALAALFGSPLAKVHHRWVVSEAGQLA